MAVWSLEASQGESLPKCPTGIDGLDEISGGGLPRHRPTLVCGGPGCGKTLLATEFLVHGATRLGEPGVLLVFEETAAEVAANARSLGFDLEALIAEGKLVVDYVHVDPHEILESGDYDLEGLFVRLEHAIQSVNAQRVVLDTLETLFAGFSDNATLRAELKRLFRWLKQRKMTAVVTAERGEGTLTRHGLEEYVSDCVILLDHRVNEQLSTRRLRIVKYRGSGHSANEFPFLIDHQGISVLPITSARLEHAATSQRVSSGVAGLDAMLGGLGYYQGSSVLISGTAGTGKTSLAAYFAKACCERGERVQYFAFEESPQQLVRNLRSIGLDLQPGAERGLLEIHSTRPSFYGLEMHLAILLKQIREFDPRAVVIDPISNFMAAGTSLDVSSMLTRLIDFLKTHQITGLLTTLTPGSGNAEESGVAVSSIIDTWLALQDVERGGERQRVVSVVKSRGMAHSNRKQPFRMTDRGLFVEGDQADMAGKEQR